MDVQYATKGKADAALTTGIIGTVSTDLGLLSGGHCTSNVFDNYYYASWADTSIYACADTPNGGFNDVTNPAA